MFIYLTLYIGPLSLLVHVELHHYVKLLCSLLYFPGGSEIRNLHAVEETQETQFRSLGQEAPLEEKMGCHFQYSCWEKSHGQRSLAGYSPRHCKESDRTEPLGRHAASPRPFFFYMNTYSIHCPLRGT